MQETLSNLTSMIPVSVDFIAVLRFVLICAAVFLGITLLTRWIFGRGSSLNRAISSAIGIIFIYAATILVYTFNPAGLSRYLAPLPLVSISADTMYLFSFTNAEFHTICKEVLSMVILAFLFDLMDDFLPKGRKLFGWLFYRILTVVMAMVLHYLVIWLFNAFLPGTITSYAPTILLVILLSMLLLGALKAVLGLVLIVVNPLIGALYAFFFASKLGKGLSKAVLTTGLLCILVVVLEHFGYGAISIAVSALTTCIPLLVAVIVLWYVIDHIL